MAARSGCPSAGGAGCCGCMFIAGGGGAYAVLYPVIGGAAEGCALATDGWRLASMFLMASLLSALGG